jgi:transposase
MVHFARGLAWLGGLTKGEEYTDQGQAYYEECYRERALRQLTQRANKLGMRLMADPQVT